MNSEKDRIAKEFEEKQKEYNRLVAVAKQVESELFRLKAIYDYLEELEKKNKKK
jgi:hypothetical protein